MMNYIIWVQNGNQLIKYVKFCLNISYFLVKYDYDYGESGAKTQIIT